MECFFAIHSVMWAFITREPSQRNFTHFRNLQRINSSSRAFYFLEPQNLAFTVSSGEASVQNIWHQFSFLFQQDNCLSFTFGCCSKGIDATRFFFAMLNEIQIQTRAIPRKTMHDNVPSSQRTAATALDQCQQSRPRINKVLAFAAETRQSRTWQVHP